MKPGGVVERRFGLWIGPTLGLLTVLMRLPFASERLYSFDSANYAFALRDYYNVAHHQPHPPGYPLYVGLAKLVDLLVQEPNRSLVLLSIAASAAAVWATYSFANAMYGRSVGLMAAVLLLTSAGFWGYGEVAYPYPFLAAASAVVALLSWRMQLGAAGLGAASGVLVGILAGIRWDAFFFLLPVWLLGLARIPWRPRLLAVGGLGLTCVLWAAPMIVLSGGLESYSAALRAQSSYVVGTFSPFAAGGLVLRLNFQTLLEYLRATLGLSLLVVVFGLGRLFAPRLLASDLRVRFLLLWLAPPLGVYLLVHIGDPGYVLSLAPPLTIMAAWTISDLARDLGSAARVVGVRWPRLALTGAPSPSIAGGAAALVVGFIALWNTNVFMSAPGPARLPEIRMIDATLDSQTEHIRTHFEPGHTLVLAHRHYRQAQYYLSGYQVRLLFDEYQPDYRASRQTLRIPAELDWVLVLDDGVAVPGGERTRRLIVREHPEVALWAIDVRGLGAIEYGFGRVAIPGAPTAAS